MTTPTSTPFAGAFQFLPAASARARLAREDACFEADFPVFARSFDDLPIDGYMADGGRYRRRRYAVLRDGGDGALAVLPSEPHYQRVEHNPLNGGVQRHFEPIAAHVLTGGALHAALRLGLRGFRSLHAQGAVHVECHQFRIEARADAEGRPTPEGMHRDGVDFVLVLLVRRENVAEGTTEIADPAGALVSSFTLTTPGDLVLLDDHRVLHGVTPIHPIDARAPAFRDVLVVTYRREVG